MPALQNPKQELFAQACARGVNASDAYKKAGYRPSRSNASVLRQQQNVSDRIDEIVAQLAKIEPRALERAVERTAISKTRVLEELGRVGFANMADYVRVSGQNRVVALEGLTREQLTAVRKIKVDPETGNVKEIELWDKMEALNKIGVELGMFVARSDNRHSIEKRYSQLPPEERRAMAEELITQARAAIARQLVIEGEAQQLIEDPAG